MTGNLQDARKRSVDNLQRLYTVVMSLAVTESLRRLLTVASGGTVGFPTLSQALMFVSLIFTIVPFYHGANRYLDATYVTGERSAKPAALMIDFVFLFLEGLGFFVLAVLMDHPEAFFTALAALLLLDAIWVGVTNLTAAGEADRFQQYAKWATVNVCAAALIVVSTWSNALNWPFWKSDFIRDIVLATTAIGRTIYDYRMVWQFYYPGQAEGPGMMPAPAPAPPPSSSNKSS